MAPLHLPSMREELPPIRTKNGCRKRTSRQNGRCESSKSSKSSKSDSTTSNRSFTGPTNRLVGLLKHRKCKDIIIMAGAGISTASGIPDFRTPGTGLYYNTSKYNVSNPTDVFDLKYFNRNPHPFLDIIRDFLKTEKQPNVIHSFCRMLETRGLLLRMYTQNIDGLEKKSGISATRLVEAHGTLETASCCKCFSAHSPTWTEKMILERKIPCCKKKGCTGYVKPDVVMFGEELPKKFYLYPKDFEKCDLLIIMGTSLNVEPFSELVDAVPKHVPRVLLNRDAVGPFSGKLRKNDILIKGDINTSIKKTLKLLGWSTGLLSENGSSSDVTESDVECNTWATSRQNIMKETLVQTTPRDVETLSLPNSVMRKQSDQTSFVNKMSTLSIEETAAKVKSRRSVSAPLPKSDQQSDVIPSKESQDLLNDTIISSVTSSEIDCASPPNTLSPSEKAFSSVTITPELSNQTSSVGSLTEDINNFIKGYTEVCEENHILKVDFGTKIESIKSEQLVLDVKTLNGEIDHKPLRLELCDMINVQHDKNIQMDKNIGQKNNLIHERNLKHIKQENDVIDRNDDPSLQTVKYDTASEQKKVTENGDFLTMTVLSNHNDISELNETPKKAKSVKHNKKIITIKGVTKLNEAKPLYTLNKQTQMKIQTKINKQTQMTSQTQLSRKAQINNQVHTKKQTQINKQMNETESEVLQINTSKKQPLPPAPRQLLRKKSSNHKIGGFNNVPSYDKSNMVKNRRSYSNLFASNTSDMFRKELKTFINTRTDSEDRPSSKGKSEICHNRQSNATRTPPDDMSAALKSHSPLSSQLNNYKKSSKFLREKLAKKEPESSDGWKLKSQDKEIVARNSIHMFNVVKSSVSGKRSVKKQVVLRTTAFRAGKPAFQWK